MPGRSPAGPLMHEHRLIERMLVVLESKLDAMGAEAEANTAFIDTAADFIRIYADRCHHGKEEDILFKRLADKDLDDALAQAMADLISDHVHGRELTHRMVDANVRYTAGDPAALAEIDSAGRALIAFYPVHINKEDAHFFKPCLEYFSAEEKAQMLVDFDEFDRALIHERYRAIVERLEGEDSA